MNDKNTEKNEKPEKDEKEKKTGAENKKKFRIRKITGYSAYIYLALAICIVTALTIGIFTMSYDTKIPQVSIPEVSLPQTNLPEVSNAPVENNESNVPQTVENKPTYPIENGKITKEFSVETLVFSATMKDYRVHTGVDIAAEKGTAVHSYADGTVAEIKSDPFYGTTVVIEHSSGTQTIYKNLAADLPVTLKEGTAVKAGEIIGAVGDTAIIEIADEPHLHFELKVGNELVNPKDELDAINK